jgi:predicted transcriptional regulator
MRTIMLMIHSNPRTVAQECNKLLALLCAALYWRIKVLNNSRARLA